MIMTDEVKKCFKCKGKGYLKEPINWFAAVFTLGMTALAQRSITYDCDACNGKGYIRTKDQQSDY